MNNEKIKQLEIKLSSKLSKRELVNNQHDFKVEQKINNSNIISLKTIPDTIRIHEEDTSLDFSIFGLNWKNVYNKKAISIACSESGKFQIISNHLGGLYISLDYGISWFLSETPSYEPIYLDNEIIGYKDDTIYNDVAISADGRYYMAVTSSNVYKLTNNLEEWSIVDISFTNIKSISISSSGKIQYLSCDEGIYSSQDYGNSWKRISNFNYKVRCSSNGRYLITSSNIESIILYSNDYGNTFNLSDSPNFIWVDSKCSGTGQYQTSITDTGKIYISDNYGENWTFNTQVEPLTSISISGSGKYRIAVGKNIYISKSFGLLWKEILIENTFESSINTIDCVSLSFDGKIAMISSDNIYTSTVDTNYIKETGFHKFKPLDETFFGKFTNITINNEIITKFNNINNTELITEMTNKNAKITSSKTGKFVSIAIYDGNIYTSSDFGLNFIKYNGFENIKEWSSIAMSRGGRHQVAIVKNVEIWRSDDIGQLWFQIPLTSINFPDGINPPDGFDLQNSFELNDIAISGNGRYQTICCSNGNILYSTNYGYNWIILNLGISNNLTNIVMSDDGKYQCVCGDNIIKYSKTYGLHWKNSTINNNYIWTSISCSSCGQYQSICSGLNSPIMTSEDYGENWNESLSGIKDWRLISVTSSGQKQLACEYNGAIYLSVDFGNTWNNFYNHNIVNTHNILHNHPNYNWLSIAVSNTLQYIFVLYNNGIIISSIINDNIIPGVITVPTKYTTNDHAIILLSGTRPNIYSYETNTTNNFFIMSSDLYDDGEVSYAVISYGETFI